MDELCAKWELEKSVNFEEYLKAVGMKEGARAKGAAAKPIVDISREGDNWLLRTTTSGTVDVHFQLGKEFESPRLDGVMIKAVIRWEGDKLVQTNFGDKEVTIVRQVVDGKLVVKTMVDDITSTRTYRKIE